MDKDEIFVPRTKRDPELYLRFSDGAMRFIYHPTFSPLMYGKEANLRKTLDWPQKTDIQCLHCCEPFDTVPVPIPLTYDVETGRIEVAAGVCCCITCLKGHLQESPQFNTPYRLALTKLMAIEVFGVAASVMERVAPPRIALKKFGGPMTLEEFRVNNIGPVLLRAAPFICRDMIFEEQRNYEEKKVQQAPAAFGDGEGTDPLTSSASSTQALMPPPAARKKTGARKNTHAAAPATAGSLTSLIKKAS